MNILNPQENHSNQETFCRKTENKASLLIGTITVEIKNTLASKLQTFSIYSVRILNILEVIAKTRISKIKKYSTLHFICIQITIDK